jgi:hypothetical protein
VKCAENDWGIDISGHQIIAVFDLVKRGMAFQNVISLCEAAAAFRDDVP